VFVGVLFIALAITGTLLLLHRKDPPTQSSHASLSVPVANLPRSNRYDFGMPRRTRPDLVPAGTAQPAIPGHPTDQQITGMPRIAEG